jgi:hypothetical protein
MRTILLCLLWLPLLVENVFAQANSAAKNAAPSGPVVEMEPYEVKADRILPNPEEWTYVKVPALVLQHGGRNIVAPGYEMLSNLNSSQTKTLVGELQLRQFAGAYLWPMLTQALPRSPIYTVVDIREQLGARFPIIGTSDTWKGDTIVANRAPPSPSNFNSYRDFGPTGPHYTSGAAFAAEYGLSQADDINAGTGIDTTETGTIGDDYVELANWKAEKYERDETVVRPLPEGSVVLASNGGPLAALVRAGELFAGMERPSEERLAATLSYELNRYAFDTFPEKLPPWFARGLGHLIGSTQVSYTLIEFAKVKEELTGRAMPKLSVLLKKTGAFTEEEQRAASLFVHYGLFADNGAYSARFMQFVTRLGNGEEPAEAMFKEIFRTSMGKLETHLTVYARDFASYKSMKVTGAIPQMPRPVYREATQSEIARIKGEMYVSQGNPGKALEELRTAYWRGERDPGMLALLAALELQIGTESRARKIISTLMALSAPPPQTYIAAARLQLKDALAAKPPGATLTGEETTALIGTLSGALAAGQTTEDLCGTLAEIILKSPTRPDPNMLAFLQQAAKRYPKNQTITDAVKSGEM